MKHLLLLLFLLLATAATSISLPMFVPVHCSAQANDCIYPRVYQNTTGIMIAAHSNVDPSTTITDSLGNTWAQDQCTGGSGACIWHTNFNPATLQQTYNIKLSLPASFISTDPNRASVFLFLYSGTWVFDHGNSGTYDTLNFPFSDCGPNGGDCPYSWTMPVEVDAGQLLIAWSHTQNGCCTIAKPGAGYSIEASDGIMAVEDMIAPTEGVYIGALTWKSTFGTTAGGSHWDMGLAAYKKNDPAIPFLQ